MAKASRVSYVPVIPRTRAHLRVTGLANLWREKYGKYGNEFNLLKGAVPSRANQPDRTANPAHYPESPRLQGQRVVKITTYTVRCFNIQTIVWKIARGIKPLPASPAFPPLNIFALTPTLYAFGLSRKANVTGNRIGVR